MFCPLWLGSSSLHVNNRAKKKLEFWLVLWAPSSLFISLAQGHFFTVNDSSSSQLMILLEDGLPGLLSIGQVSFKHYLRSKKFCHQFDGIIALLFQISSKMFKTQSTRKESNFNFQWTKTFYQNNLKNIAFFFTFFKG